MLIARKLNQECTLGMQYNYRRAYNITMKIYFYLLVVCRPKYNLSFFYTQKKKTKLNENNNKKIVFKQACLYVLYIYTY